MELLHSGDGGSVVLGLFTYTGDFLVCTESTRNTRTKTNHRPTEKQ